MKMSVSVRGSARRTMKANKQNSPYSAAVTGCGFMLDETVALTPILAAPDAELRLKAEIEGNRSSLLGKSKTRSRMITEFKRRYNAMPPSFWNWFLSLDRSGQTVALYYCLMRTYLIVKDVHLNLVLPRMKSANPVIVKADVERHICTVAAVDSFVEGWSDVTKGKVAGSCLSYLRALGMLSDSRELHPVPVADSVAGHFISRGEGWYLESLGMPLYEINRVKEGRPSQP